MRKINTILVIILDIITWNYANYNLEPEEKIRTSPEFQSLNYPKEFGIDKLLKSGYPAISTG